MSFRIDEFKKKSTGTIEKIDRTLRTLFGFTIDISEKTLRIDEFGRYATGVIGKAARTLRSTIGFTIDIFNPSGTEAVYFKEISINEYVDINVIIRG